MSDIPTTPENGETPPPVEPTPPAPRRRWPPFRRRAKAPKPAKPRSKLSRLWRWPLKGLGWLSLILFFVVGLVLAAVIFFPINRAKDRAVEYLRDDMKLDMSAGHMDYSIFSGLEINDFALGPPAGYDKPILVAKKLVVRYAPWSLNENTFIVDQVLIDSPHVNIETKNGKLNVIALLESLPKSEAPPEPEPPPEPEEPPGEPSDFKIVLNEFALRNFTAWVDDGQRTIDFRRLDVGVSGHFSQQDSHFDVEVNIAGDDPEAANIHIEQREPMKVVADVLVALAIKISADQVLTPKATTSIELRVATKKLETEWPLAPVDLRLSLAAAADMPGDSAELSSLSVRFNNEELVKMKARAVGLTAPKSADVLLEKIFLPLDVFAPYAKAFVEGVDFGGTVAIENLAVKGEVPKLLEKGLPTLNGDVVIDGVWADYRPAQAKLRGLDMKLALATQPVEAAQGLDAPALKAAGYVAIGSAGAPQARIENARIDIDARADGLEVAEARAKIGVSLPTIVVIDPTLGEARLSLRTDLDASANLKSGHFSVDRLAVNVSDTVALDVRAKADIDLATQAVRRYEAKLALGPIELKKLLAMVPPGIAKDLPKLKLDGAFGATFASQGSIPPGVGDPFALPVSLDGKLSFDKISVDYPAQKLAVKQFGGEITIKGKPADLRVGGGLAIAGIHKADQTASLKDIAIPIDIHFTPKQANVMIGIETAGIVKEDLAARLDQVRIGINADVAGDILKQKFTTLRGGILADVGDIVYAKDLIAKLKGFRFGMEFDYDQTKRRANLGVFSMLDRLDAPDKQAALSDFSFRADLTPQGVDVPLGAHFDAIPEEVQFTVDMGIGGIEKTDVFSEPLKDTSLKVKALLKDMKDLDLETLAFAMPALGARLEMTGKVWDVLNADYQPPNFKDVWPDFNVELFAGLDLKRKQKLISGLEASGLAGVKTQVRSLPGNFARVEGTIIGESFNFWSTTTGEKVYDDGRREPTHTEVHIKDFDAQAPLIQIVDLQTFMPVEAQRSIFDAESRTVIYTIMRQYLKQESNFHIDEVTLSQKEGDVERKLAINEIAFDMMYSDNTFALNRMYVDLLGGGVSGSLMVQVLSFPPKPFDARIHIENQIAGVNLGYLTKKDPAEVSRDTEISSLLELDLGLKDKVINGRIDITRLSLKQLDELLAFLDPKGKDPNVQKNRKLINAWYVDAIDPKVNLVALWIAYSNLNVDIELSAMWPVGDILNDTLKRSLIRRLNINPILRSVFKEEKPEETGGDRAAAPPAEGGENH
ncbi:MAG: hypothetical protein C4523_08615 [Myxococcales bacterium]|nr:MAG: hypothetical protein C4523_08615 [Myxococcales bacterium]